MNYAKHIAADNKTFTLIAAYKTPAGKKIVQYQCHQNGLVYTRDEVINLKKTK